MKQEIKQVLSEFYEKGIPSFTPRNYPIPEFEKITKAISVIGPRRAGKTYFLYQIMDYFINKGNVIEDFIYINFEDQRLWNFSVEDFETILKVYSEFFGNKQPVIFLDEIQIVDKWELFVNRLLKGQYQVYLTGSNSKMLSKDIATSLRGRTYSIEIFPFSFSEYLRYNNVSVNSKIDISKNEKKIRKLFLDFFNLSGYPEIIIEGELQFVNDYFESVFYKDMIERYKIRNHKLLHFFLNYIAHNYASEFTTYKLHNFAKSNGFESSTSTIHHFIDIAKESYFAFFLEKYEKSLKKREQAPKKLYSVDHGFPNYFAGKDRVDKGRLLENIVFNHQMRSQQQLNYFKGKNECDFVNKECIQVTWELNGNTKREIKGALEASNFLGKDPVIVTYDDEKEINVDGKTISVIPIWKFLL